MCILYIRILHIHIRRHLGGGLVDLPQRDQQARPQGRLRAHLLLLARAPVVVHQDLGRQGRQVQGRADAAACARAGQLGGLQGRVHARLAAVDRGVALRQELRLLEGLLLGRRFGHDHVRAGTKLM